MKHSRIRSFHLLPQSIAYEKKKKEKETTVFCLRLSRRPILSELGNFRPPARALKARSLHSDLLDLFPTPDLEKPLFSLMNYGVYLPYLPKTSL